MSENKIRKIKLGNSENIINYFDDRISNIRGNIFELKSRIIFPWHKHKKIHGYLELSNNKDYCINIKDSSQVFEFCKTCFDIFCIHDFSERFEYNQTVSYGYRIKHIVKICKSCKKRIYFGSYKIIEFNNHAFDYTKTILFKEGYNEDDIKNFPSYFHYNVMGEVSNYINRGEHDLANYIIYSFINGTYKI